MLATIFPAAAIAADENRIAGLDRYATAIAISQTGWSAAANVVLAPAADANRTDTLSAAPLAKVLAAPILLTDGKTLNAATAAEISRLGAKNVYIISGTGVITPAVHEALRDRGLAPVALGGANRFETAVNIAGEIAKHAPVTTVVFTSTRNDADALSMASLAAANGWVLLPAERDALSPAVTAWLGGQSITKTYVIGNSELLSDAAVAALPAVTRIGAADPYTNNAAILEHFANDFDYSRGLFVSSGESAHLVDAVTASAYLSGAPLFLAPSSVTAGSAAAAVLEKVIGAKTTTITAIGGTGAVSSASLTTVNQAASGTLPAGGGGESPAPAPIPGGSGGNSLPIPGRINVSSAGDYSVPQPGSSAVTNYLLLNISGGDYSNGAYDINATTVTATPVLTSGSLASLVKVEVPAGLTAGTLTVVQNGSTRLTREFTLPSAGAAAPAVFYGETPMAFSEFYHDVTADITAVQPAVTSFAAGGAVAKPEYFINAGTRTGNGPAGNGTLPTYADADSQPAVDAVSSATYGDSVHFPPTGNLTLNYADPTSKTDANNKITGVKAVEVGVDFDLYANAWLLNAAQRATAQSAAVLSKAEALTPKAASAVYKAKYLFPDASWGARDTVTASVASAWPTNPAISASYGGTWANRVISINYAPLPGDLTSADLWNTYFEQIYGGYVEDLTTGQREPLVWLQNLFSHRGHTNFEVALNREGISRMNALTGAGDFRFVVFAKGLPDVTFDYSLVEYAVSDAEIEQGTAFFVNADHLLGANTQPLAEGDKLHIVGLSREALADFASGGGKLMKGTAEVPANAYALSLVGGGGELQIELLAPFFGAGFQGAYTASINAATIYQMPSFTVYRAVNRPDLTYDSSSYSATADSPLSVDLGGGTIGFSDSAYAAAITASGRGSVSSISVVSGDGAAPAIGDVLKRSGNNTSPYIIDPSALTPGTVYKLSIVAANHAYLDGSEYKTTAIDYYITTGAQNFAVPNLDGSGVTNYILFNKNGISDIKLNSAAVTATPVLGTNLVKVKVPDGATSATLALGGYTQAFSGLTAGVAAPAVLYGETPMAFSEFYHDITADITAVHPAATSFATGGVVAEPEYFINAGTRTGNGPDGNGTLPTYTEADSQPAVDAVSSATYGDNPHFPPTGNLTLNYADPQSKTDANNKITGIKAVEAGVDFDLYANAWLLDAAGLATAQSAAVLAKAQALTLKAASAVYKAKYLFPDASWGARDTVTAAAASAWPSAPTVTASYGGTWADRVLSLTYSGPTSQVLWNTYFEQLYGGYVEDLTTGQREPLVWLQNLFSHRGHMNFEVALNRAGISRMNALTGNGDFKFVIFAKGLPDVVVDRFHLSDYEVSEASIEQGTAFYVTGGGDDLLNVNNELLGEGNKLHIVNLSPAALADFAANGGDLKRGNVVVTGIGTAYHVGLVNDNSEVEIAFEDSFFATAYRGAYTFTINPSPGTVYKTLSFSINAALDARPEISSDGSTYVVAADTGTALLVNQGDIITFDEQDFAAAITVGGRGSSIALVPPDTGVILPAATAVIVRPGAAGSPYQIDTTALIPDKTYAITIAASNYAYLDGGTFKTNPVYYVTLNP
jgi:hypothetical protein